MIDKDFFINWFNTNGRDFPWRKDTVTPFVLLITEFLLRQTRADAVLSIWDDFTNQYHDAKTLSCVSRELLTEQISILGFGKQRASALQEASIWLIDHHQGEVPNNLDDLLLIPHVGMYISKALLCFAFNNKVEIVDTNVLRLLSRHYGLEVKPDIRRNPHVWEIANQLLPEHNELVKMHNYGILDFTALVCCAKKPKCVTCELLNTCRYSFLQL